MLFPGGEFSGGTLHQNLCTAIHEKFEICASRFPNATPENKTARARLSARAAGGTVGIDQEVVTLRGLFGNSGSQHDLTLGGSEP
jgi:hypothetical protein